LAWRARDPASIRWREWDDAYVVHHVPSGSTHFLDATAGCALLRMQDAEVGIEDLARAVADELDLDAVPLASHMETLLAELERLGIVERVAR